MEIHEPFLIPIFPSISIGFWRASRTIFQSKRKWSENQVIGVTSPFLLAELNEVLTKKFKFSRSKIRLIEAKIKKKFRVVNPGIIIDVLGNNPDNHVLEAALTGNCQYIITGDRELDLKSFKGIDIIHKKATEFLAI